jgi:two-component system chemotaxis response regulator CheB
VIRVLIADDSAFMRKVLSDLFHKQPDFDVVGTAMNGKDAISKVKQLKPDLLTMDVNMPVMDGLECIGCDHGRMSAAGCHAEQPDTGRH